MTVFKVPLLLLSAVSYDIAIGHPCPTAPDDTLMISFREQVLTRVALFLNIYLKATMYLAVVSESIVILDSLYGVRPPSSTVATVLNALGPPSASRLTATFVLSATLVIASAIVRIRCYSALGHFFTFVQCIRKGHKLITDGPYGVVRHPAYGALVWCIIGAGMMHGSRDAWVRTSGVLNVPWVWATYVGWWAIMALSFATLFARVKDEDAFLSQHFGKEWDAWARRVRYRLLPFVY